MIERAVLQGADIARALTRIAHEIVEQSRGADDLVLLGIPTRGAFLAERLGVILADIAPHPIPVGTIDVTMYRDDLAHQPTRVSVPTVLPPGGIDGRTVVLVDDVLYSGRTVYATDLINRSDAFVAAFLPGTEAGALADLLAGRSSLDFSGRLSFNWPSTPCLTSGEPAGEALFARLAADTLAEGGGRLAWNVLDWNTPAIATYDAMGADTLKEWITRRLAGDALRSLAAEAA